MSNIYKTSIENFTLRRAEEKDAELILSFIEKLADYENMSDDVSGTVEDIKKTIFEDKYAEVLFGELDGKAVGICLYFYKYSTFLARPTLHIEDLFYDVEYRGNGFGSATFSVMATIAKEKNCGRMEWNCLDWNEPSIKFYEGLGAKSMPEWITFRLTDDTIDALSKKG